MKTTTFRRALVLSAACFTLGALGASHARAASIGVNFGAGNTSTDLDPADVAGTAPYAQTNYNNVATVPTDLALNDDSGAATTTLLTLTGSTFRLITNTVAGADEILNNGVASTTGASQSFTLSSCTDWTSGRATGRASPWAAPPTISAARATNTAGFVDGDAATAFTYTQATSTDPAAPTANADYVVFTGLTGSSLTLTNIKGAGSYALMGGFQIIQTNGVPEPSAWVGVAAGVGLLGLSLRRRARRA